MEKTEMSILNILTEDARTPISQIAVMLGESEATIADTIARLERQRTMDFTLGGEHLFGRLSADWSFNYARASEERPNERYIYRFEEVSSVYLMSGGYDLLVNMKARTMRQLALFVAEKLSTIEHVISTATHFVLKKYKDQGVLMDETTEDLRLKVTP